MLIRQNFNRYLAEETISIDLVSTQKPEEPACLQANLSEAQYLTLQILILLLLSSQNGTIREISCPISSTNYLWKQKKKFTEVS